MTNWFVDSAAAGDESALTPANARINIRSMSHATSFYPGDRCWISKRYREDYTGNFNLTRNYDEFRMRDRVEVIGWPSPGDPMYDHRPQAGIDAGWDAHTQANANTQGVNYPSLVSSASAFSSNMIQQFEGSDAMNLFYQNSAAAGTSVWDSGGDPEDDGRWNDNIFVSMADHLAQRISNFGKMTLTTKDTGNNPMLGNELTTISELVVGSATTAKAIFRQDSRFYADRVMILSNSLQSIALALAEPSNRAFIDVLIGSIYGVEPFGTLETSGDFENLALLPINDYFGRGPYQENSQYGQWRFRPTSGTIEIQKDSGDCHIYQHAPQIARNVDFAAFFGPKRILSQAVFDVESGTKYSVAWPMYTNNWSLAPGDGAVFSSRVIQGGAVDREITSIGTLNLTAGTAGDWTGSLDTGSAWIFTTSLEAQFTGKLGLGLMNQWYSVVKSSNTADGQWSHSGFIAVAHTPALAS